MCLFLPGFSFTHKKKKCLHCCHPAEFQVQWKLRKLRICQSRLLYQAYLIKIHVLAFSIWLRVLKDCLEKKATWQLPPWLRNLPMMVESSQRQETKWEKCKCKCWEGPSGQGIADPFNDLPKEIGSRNIRKQATCMQKNEKVHHQNWIIRTSNPSAPFQST